MTNLLDRIRKQPDMKEEMKRRISKRKTLLQMLKRRGELNTHDLAQFGTGVSSRIHELRKEGHIIVIQYEKPGLYRYIYLGDRREISAV